MPNTNIPIHIFLSSGGYDEGAIDYTRMPTNHPIAHLALSPLTPNPDEINRGPLQLGKAPIPYRPQNRYIGELILD